MGSSYSRRTRSNGSSSRSKVASSSDMDQDNNTPGVNSGNNFIHERKDSNRFWISHVKFRKRSSGDIRVRRSSSEQKPTSRLNPKTYSEEQTRRNSKTGLNKSLSFDAVHVKSSPNGCQTEKERFDGTSIYAPSLGNEENGKSVENSIVVNQCVNLKNRLLSVTQLYNILNDGALSPCICDPTYILLIDARSKELYDTDHILMAQHSSCVSSDLHEEGVYGFPAKVNASEFTWVIIYGNEITDDANDNDEIQLMHELDASYDAEAFVLTSGFNSFSKKYPFLCSNLERVDFKMLQVYPSAILDNQLFQGRGDQATNLKVITDLQITHIVNITQEHASAFPEKVTYLTLKLDDVSHTQLIKYFDRTTDFITNALSSGGRVLVHCNLGVSRSSTVNIAYLIHANKWTLRQAYDFLKDKRTCIRPNRGFLKQLGVWEELQLGEKHTDPDDLWF